MRLLSVLSPNPFVLMVSRQYIENIKKETNTTMSQYLGTFFYILTVLVYPNACGRRHLAPVVSTVRRSEGAGAAAGCQTDI